MHTIPGRDTVVTGRVERGRVKVGESIEIAGRSDLARDVVVTGIQALHKDIPEATAGLDVGLLLLGLDRQDVDRGAVVIAPKSLRARSQGAAEIFVLTAAQGGRHTPFATGYAPQFYFGAADVPAVLDTEGATEPGDRATVRFALARPTAFEAGMRFVIREGGKTIGAGVVTAVQ